eukprot:c27467_g1_i1 orf=128-2011(+)
MNFKGTPRWVPASRPEGARRHLVSRTDNAGRNFLRNALPREDVCEEGIRDNAEEEEDDDDDDSEIDDEEKRLKEEKAYQKYLPEVKELVKQSCGNERPNLLADKGEKLCAVCPNAQLFKGWTALLAHAGQFKKKRPQMHRGYHRALSEALRVNERPPEQETQQEGRALSLNPELTRGHLILWPPVVMLEIVNSEPGEDPAAWNAEKILCLLSEELQNLHPGQVLPVPANRNNEQKSIIVFEASAVGYLEAKRLGDRLAERRRGREHWLNLAEGRHGRHADRWSDKHDARGNWRSVDQERQLQLYGYLAEPQDMQAIDPSRVLVKGWTEESYYDKVQSAQKKTKQDHDKEQAMLKAAELHVENLTEDERRFRTSKQRMEQLIQLKQKEIDAQKKRTEEMEQRFLEAMHSLDRKFQTDMKSFEAMRNAKVKRLREQLEISVKKSEEERSLQVKKVESLEKKFMLLAEDHKKQETRKALLRQHMAMQKTKNFRMNMEKVEAAFNEQARQTESALQEQQHREMMELMEDSKRERESILKEWLEKQETLKKKSLEAKEAKERLQNDVAEQSNECAVCWESLSEGNRALLNPCGHAKLCIDCATDIFKGTKLCPICRQEIKREPIICPKKIYM